MLSELHPHCLVSKRTANLEVAVAVSQSFGCMLPFISYSSMATGFSIFCSILHVTISFFSVHIYDYCCNGYKMIWSCHTRRWCIFMIVPIFELFKIFCRFLKLVHHHHIFFAWNSFFTIFVVLSLYLCWKTF